jgi:hypothetical protein
MSRFRPRNSTAAASSFLASFEIVELLKAKWTLANAFRATPRGPAGAAPAVGGDGLVASSAGLAVKPRKPSRSSGIFSFCAGLGGPVFEGGTSLVCDSVCVVVVMTLFFEHPPVTRNTPSPKKNNQPQNVACGSRMTFSTERPNLHPRCGQRELYEIPGKIRRRSRGSLVKMQMRVREGGGEHSSNRKIQRQVRAIGFEQQVGP